MPMIDIDLQYCRRFGSVLGRLRQLGFVCCGIGRSRLFFNLFGPRRLGRRCEACCTLSPCGGHPGAVAANGALAPHAQSDSKRSADAHQSRTDRFSAVGVLSVAHHDGLFGHWPQTRMWASCSALHDMSCRAPPVARRYWSALGSPTCRTGHVFTAFCIRAHLQQPNLVANIGHSGPICFPCSDSLRASRSLDTTILAIPPP